MTSDQTKTQEVCQRNSRAIDAAASIKFKNIFVLCTGRCGSVSFAKACSHFTNYSSGHETRIRTTGDDRLRYPDGHIEVDNRLSWFLGRLQEKYGDDALYVHLTRSEQQVAASYDRRWHHHGSLIEAFNQGIMRHDLPHGHAASELVRTINENIRCFLRDKPHTMTIDIDRIPTQFPEFARRIGAEGNLSEALQEFTQRHNATNAGSIQRSRQSLPIVRLSIKNRKLKKQNRTLWVLAAPVLVLLLPILLPVLLLRKLAKAKGVTRWSPLTWQSSKSLVHDAFLVHHAEGNDSAVEMLGENAPAGATEIFRAMSVGADEEWLDLMNAWGSANGLPEMTLMKGVEPRYHRLRFHAIDPVAAPEKVSVIMSAFNAASTINQAAESILTQSWQNLELIIVNDASTDGTAEIIEHLATRDERVRVLHNPRNVGPFVSKNRAIKFSTGRYVTGHDADDIAVPTRIADQMEPIMHLPACAATVTYMIRVDSNGILSQTSDICSYSYDGISKKAMISLLVDRELLTSKIGYWDSVRFGGDSELLRRVAAYLDSRLREVKKIGLVCLDADGSLTNDRQHGVSCWEGVSPVRSEYQKSWSAWHRATPRESRYVPFPHLERRFSAPPQMLVPDEDVAEAAGWAAYEDVLLKKKQKGSGAKSQAVPINRPQRVGIVSYWFNRGQAVVSRRIRAALADAGFETYVLARPTKSSFAKSSFIDRSDVWAQAGVTEGSQFQIPEHEYLRWAAEHSLDVILFDQNLQFREIAALRRRSIRTIGRFVWEAFGPDDVPDAVAAFDVIYSMTRCEQRRYKDFGIDSPHVRWGCPKEFDLIQKSPRADSEVRFFYPGGYLTDRKPTSEVIEAFCGVRDPRARLILKVQHAKRGRKLIKKARNADPRIHVIVDDLPDAQHHQLMASADVCLAPTRWEGLGLHHTEAIALGLPCITNDFPPMNENVTHGVDGWLIPAVWSEERLPGVPRLESPVDEIRKGIEALCDDDYRQHLNAGVAKRRESMQWANTEKDLVALVTGRLKAV